MDLDYYLWKNQIGAIKFAKSIGIAGSTLTEILARRGSPSLLTATKITIATQGKVHYIDLLSNKDRKEIMKIIPQEDENE